MEKIVEMNYKEKIECSRAKLILIIQKQRLKIIKINVNKICFKKAFKNNYFFILYILINKYNLLYYFLLIILLYNFY